MKLLFIIILFFTYQFAGTQVVPDFNNRHVAREIKKVFSTDQYSLRQIHGHENNLSFKEIRQNETLIGFVYINRVNSCRSGMCQISDKNDSEYFDYLIIYNQKGEVKSVRVFNYAATHGQQIASAGWLRQFWGFKGDDDKQVGKNVDAIAGATISANAITEDINKATKALHGFVD